MKNARLKMTALFVLISLCVIAAWQRTSALAQMTDRTKNPNVANFGIAKSLTQEIAALQ